MNFDKNFDFAEYKMLADLLKQQHVRYNDFCRICLTGNAILLGFLGFLLKEGASSHSLWVPRGIAFVGIAICFVWILTLCRIRQDVRQYQWQLLMKEAKTEKDGIFTKGRRYMIDHKPLESEKLSTKGPEPLRFPGWWFFPARFRAHWMGHCFAWVFVAAYVLSIVFVFSSGSADARQSADRSHVHTEQGVGAEKAKGARCATNEVRHGAPEMRETD